LGHGREDVTFDTLRPEHSRLAGALLARSHRHDPAFSAVYGDPGLRITALTMVFEQWCRDALAFGRVDAMHVGDRLAGIAVWLPPGAFPPSARRQLRFLPDYLPMLRLDPRSFLLLVRYMSRAAKLHPAGCKWYLEIVGLDDGFRGRGLGQRLLQRGLIRADEQGLPCYLETSKATNVGWYERLGFFVALPALQIVPRGPTHWTMWRPVQRTA
jgi:GNAT superfamily N-acetyltransferase